MLKAFVVSLIGLSFFPHAWAADPTPTAGASPAVSEPKLTLEQKMAQWRNDLQSKRAEIMGKAVTLNADQAAKFWPLFEQYQKEQNALIDEQMAAIRKYSASYDTLSDADSLAFVNALLDRDAKMQALRVRWLPKFQAVIPGGQAARVIQLDRRLSLLGQLDIASQIPLVH